MPSPLLHPKLPKYAQLAEQIRIQISSGQLKAGDRLPSFMEMRTQQGVSQGIMERAYALLEQDGLVERQPGRGTFVVEPTKHPETKILGLVLHIDSKEMATPYAMQWLAGVKSEAAKHGFKIHWLSNQDEANIRHENLDAILMYCHPSEALAMNLPANLPHVLMFWCCSDFVCVGTDDFNGAKIAAEYLLSLGHRRICYLATSPIDSISQQRVEGFHTALNKAGITPEKRKVRFLTDYRTLGFRKSSEEAMETWLKDGWQELGCTAVVAHNDETAIGIIKTLTSHGLRVPEDVSVIGFDGTEISELCTPSLTTIKVPLQEIGERAVKVLLEQINGGAMESEQNILSVQLKLGESTAPLNSLIRQTVLL